MKRKHLGSNFEKLLKQDGILESCRAMAIGFKLTQAQAKGSEKQRRTGTPHADEGKGKSTEITKILLRVLRALRGETA